MERLWRYDRELLRQPETTPLLERWLNALRDTSRMGDKADSAATQLSTLAMHMGLRELALSIANSSTGASMRADVAQILSQSNRFFEAALWWDKALEIDPTQHRWILEAIDANRIIGDEDKARRYESSRWMRPLSIDRYIPSYAQVASELQRDSQYPQAREYAEAAFALSGPGLSALGPAVVYAEILDELEDFAKSADAHRAANVMLLMEPPSRIALSTIQHAIAEEFQARALAELDAGQAETALDRIRRFENLRPFGIEICELTYDRLVKNGRQAAADQILDRCSSRLLAHLDKWPKDAGIHNNLAWLWARCNQRLEESLAHAQLAVELSSGVPTYVDTLAEAHFRLGHVAEAVELGEKCVYLDPRHAHYRKQLQRFRDAR
jgi:tetratricopeptide (TPR) repeat protein